MNLIFDFDGTICDSIGAAVNIANKILKENGIRETSITEVKKIGLKGLIKSRKVPLTKIAKVVAEYREASRENYENYKIIRGLDGVLKKINKKYTLGILTTNEVENVKNFTSKNNINIFKFIKSEKNVFGKAKGLKKILSEYKLSPKETCFIGDETRDIEAAKKAGVKSVAVTWGAESKTLLKKGLPDLVITNPEDLLRL